MNWFRLSIYCIVTSLFPILCFGSNFSFSKISVENGLSNNQVNVIFKDSYGFMWFGTFEGLDRYDGVEIRSYAQRFPEAVGNVNSISEDSEKQLWIGTATGLFYRNNKDDRFERVPLNRKNIAVRSLAFVLDTVLCVGTTTGLFLVNSRTKKSEHILLNDVTTEKENYINGILTDNIGNCWLATHNGLIKYSLTDQKKEFFQCNLFPLDAYNSFSSICNIGNKIYLGTSYMGLLEFDSSTKNFTRGVDVDNKIILTMATDKKERLFVGTDGGGLKVVNIKSGDVTDIDSQENNSASLSSNSVYSFYLDQNDRYWVGTYTGGVNYTNSFKLNFKLHPVTSGNSDESKNVRSFYFAPDGTQYLGTRNGVIQIGKGGDANTYQVDAENKMGLRSNIILSLYPYNGAILIGTYGGGISLLSPGERKIRPFLTNSIFDKGNTHAFETDNKGNLWIATFIGIYRYSPGNKSFVNFNKQNSDLVNDEIFDLLFDSKGRLWVGTMSGISVFSVNGDRLIKTKIPDEGKINFKVNCIYEDQSGNIWLCTERGGVAMFDQSLSKVKFFQEADGLPDNSVCAIVEGNKGEYWLSTLKGFCKYTARNKRFVRYSLSDGLPGLVFSPAASFYAPDGNIYFGNEKGLVYFNPAAIERTSKTDKICITDFFVSGKPVVPGEKSVLKQSPEATKTIELDSWSNSIGFRFVNLNFANSIENSYQYRLEGFDKDWKSNGNRNTVFYENLKPGSYIFEVRNGNESDGNTASFVDVKVQIRKSFFNLPIFFILLLLLVAGGGFVFVKYIVGRKKKEALLLLPATSKKVEKCKGNKIPEYQSSIIHEITRAMETKKPYLNAEFKLADLASEIKFPLHEISHVLNQGLNQSFPDFVNKYRVEEVQKRLKDKAYDRFTFFAIAQQCGFNSKTSFYRTFKNETGKTPADYVKDLHK